MVKTMHPLAFDKEKEVLNMPSPSKITKVKKYSWDDYLSWPDDERWEVIDGVAYNMTPSPTTRHQRIVGNIFRILGNNLAGTPCVTFVAPLDVIFDEYNFVQPDVFVVCDKEKIKDRIYGAPHLIIEVLSPSTSLKDKREKKRLYEKFGVREYIIVHPEELFIERYALDKDRFNEADLLGSEEILTLNCIDDVTIPLWEIFEVPPPEKSAGENEAQKN